MLSARASLKHHDVGDHVVPQCIFASGLNVAFAQQAFCLNENPSDKGFLSLLNSGFDHASKSRDIAPHQDTVAAGALKKRICHT